MAGSTEMRRYLLVHFMYMCLLQALSFSDCLWDIRRRWNCRWIFIVILRVALRCEGTVTRSVTNFSERQRDSRLSFKQSSSVFSCFSRGALCDIWLMFLGGSTTTGPLVWCAFCTIDDIIFPRCYTETKLIWWSIFNATASKKLRCVW